MKTYLTVQGPAKDEAHSSGYYYVFDQDEILVGRDEHVDVRLPHPAVSLVHLRLLRKKTKLSAIDLGSTNGTRLNGKGIPSQQPVLLPRTSRLEIGPFQLTLAEEDPRPRRPEKQNTAAFARQMALEILGVKSSHSRIYFQVQNGPQQGERFELSTTGEKQTIGRAAICQLLLRDADVSRRHLEVWWEKGTLLIHDLQSKNGYWVNDQPRRGVVELQDSDEIRVGQTILKLAIGAERYLQDIQQSQDEPMLLDEGAHISGQSSATAGAIEQPQPPSDDPVAIVRAESNQSSNPASYSSSSASVLFSALMLSAGLLVLAALVAIGYLFWG